MINMAKIDEIVTRLSDALPPGAARMKEDVEARFSAVLRGAFERMDLVTREEFDEQRAQLAEAQSRLDALQRRIDQAES